MTWRGCSSRTRQQEDDLTLLNARKFLDVSSSICFPSTTKAQLSYDDTSQRTKRHAHARKKRRGISFRLLFLDHCAAVHLHHSYSSTPIPIHAYLSLLASRSDSSKQRMSSSLTVGYGQYFWSSQGFRIRNSQIVPGPLTLRMMERVVSSMNSTRT